MITKSTSTMDDHYDSDDNDYDSGVYNDGDDDDDDDNLNSDPKVNKYLTRGSIGLLPVSPSLSKASICAPSFSKISHAFQ